MVSQAQTGSCAQSLRDVQLLKCRRSTQPGPAKGLGNYLLAQIDRGGGSSSIMRSRRGWAEILQSSSVSTGPRFQVYRMVREMRVKQRCQRLTDNVWAS